MILVQHNYSFVNRTQYDHSYTGKIKYHLIGRIYTLGTALVLLAEAVGRIVVAFLATCMLCKKAFASEQFQYAKEVGSLSLDYFGAIFKKLESLPPPGKIRENRVRMGDELIAEKLRREWLFAQIQMHQELQQKSRFQYEVGELEPGIEDQAGPYHVGISQHIGRRAVMEDEHLVTSFDFRVKKKVFPIQLFGIFDGHGGTDAAKYLKANLREKLISTLREFNQSRLTDEGIWNALKMTFVRMNQDFKGDAGSTATVAMILDGKLWTANVGDSRIILDNGGETVQLTEDQKPADKRYEKGIVNRGGWVACYGCARVNGNIAMARAFGDHFLKGALSARPKITTVRLSNIARDSHLVLCCDGIYDVASTKQIGEAVHAHKEETPLRLAKNIVFSAFRAVSMDNLSAMVVKLP